MRVAAFFCLLLVVSVAVHFDSPYLMSDLVRWGATGLFLILAAPLSRLAILDKLGRRVWDFILRHGSAVVPLLALLVFAATSVICHAVLDPIPHISDEISYLFQARVFASGHLTLPAPSMPGFFPAEWIIVHDDRWFSVFPPGWPLLLSLGVRLGVPSLVNPFLGALTILALHRLAVHLAGPTKALAVALLCAVSPFFLFMCASFMSHPASLLFATLCLLLLLKASDSGNAAWFALAGCCAGFGFLVRPLDAAVLWSVPAAFLLLRHRTRRQLLGSGLSALGFGAGVVVYLAYNHAVTGQWLVSPLGLTSPHNRFGFGADIGLPWSGFPEAGHNLRHAALNLDINLAVISADLFGWPTSSLWPLLLLVCLGRLAWPHRLAILMTLGLVCGYALYWYHGVCFGARFYFSCLPLLLILTVEGLTQAPAIVASRLGLGGATRSSSLPLKAFVALSFAFCALVYFPMVSLFEPYHNQRNVDRSIDRFVAARSIERGIVFVGPGAHDFGRNILANALDPMLGNTIYAFDLGPKENQRLTAQFPERPVFYFKQGDSGRAWPPSLARVLRTGYMSAVLGEAIRHGDAAP